MSDPPVVAPVTGEEPMHPTGRRYAISISVNLEEITAQVGEETGPPVASTIVTQLSDEAVLLQYAMLPGVMAWYTERREARRNAELRGYQDICHLAADMVHDVGVGHFHGDLWRTVHTHFLDLLNVVIGEDPVLSRNPTRAERCLFADPFLAVLQVDLNRERGSYEEIGRVSTLLYEHFSRFHGREVYFDPILATIPRVLFSPTPPTAEGYTIVEVTTPVTDPAALPLAAAEPLDQ